MVLFQFRWVFFGYDGFFAVSSLLFGFEGFFFGFEGFFLNFEVFFWTRVFLGFESFFSGIRVFFGAFFWISRDVFGIRWVFLDSRAILALAILDQVISIRTGCECSESSSRGGFFCVPTKTLCISALGMAQRRLVPPVVALVQWRPHQPPKGSGKGQPAPTQIPVPAPSATPCDPFAAGEIIVSQKKWSP